ncbi:MAG: metallophosphoesterase [Saprospiraceae bacterium]|nr:metallophosphoesterase [Saprospiraceae bacterium]
MLLNQIFCVALLTLPLPLFAHGEEPIDDRSKADVDGPHVFYRGSNVVVKSVERYDTSTVARTKVYTNKNMVTLTCRIPETGDQFSFKLRDSLAIEPDHYEMPARLLALSDIEGNFKAFKTMLLGAKVIDEQFNWTFGDGHLVLLGDYFDRGLNVTECLWLAYKLEAEAEAAGGKVHFILGNHETMNLEGNTSYVRKKYLENATLINEEYKRWYDNHSELGRWLRTKNAVEKIGTFVFCHGGISPELARTKLTLSEINHITRKNLGVPLESMSGAARAIFDYKTGIFWYRSIAKNIVPQEDVNTVLHYASATKMIVAHTIYPDVTALYGGSVICIDVFHDENIRLGFVRTLWVEDGLCYTLDTRGIKTTLLLK